MSKYMLHYHEKVSMISLGFFFEEKKLKKKRKEKLLLLHVSLKTLEQ